MLHQKTQIPKYTDIINSNNKNKNKNKPVKRPNMDAIINEQRAEELRKKMLVEQSEHNLDDIPAEILLESYMLSQIEEQKDKDSNNSSNTNNDNNNNNNNNDKTQEERDRLLAMQLEFALEEDSGLANIDNVNYNMATATNADNTTTTTNSSANKKSWKGNTNRHKNETKIRIQPNYYFDDQDKNNGERNYAGEEEEEHGYDDTEEDIYNRSKNNNNNNNNSKVRNELYGNKTALSGTANRHRFEEWSEKHVSRLHEYNANLGGESEFKNVRLGNKAYNSFRRDLEKKGFKKFDQPTPAEKK